MPTYRIVIRIQNFLNKRSYSEQFYASNLAYAGVDDIPLATIRGIGVARAQCLVATNGIPVIRVNDVDTPKIVRNFPVNLVGALPGLALPGRSAQDVVNVSRYVTLNAANGSVSRYLQRGCLDSDVVGGEFTFATSGPAPYDNWLRYLKVFPLQLRGSSFGAPQAIATIGPAGIVLPAGGIAPANGQILNIKTQISGPGPKLNVRAKVVSSNGLNVSLGRWIWGNCTGGNFRVVGYTYGNIISFDNSQTEARTRKTGGPISKFRGRRSSRRQSTGV